MMRILLTFIIGSQAIRIRDDDDYDFYSDYSSADKGLNEAAAYDGEMIFPGINDDQKP